VPSGPDRFRVALNPNPDSRLPYLVYLPVAGEDPVILATRDTWCCSGGAAADPSSYGPLAAGDPSSSGAHPPA